MIRDMHSKQWHLYLAYIHIVEFFDVAYRMAHDDVACGGERGCQENGETQRRTRDVVLRSRLLPLLPLSLHVAYFWMPTWSSTATKIVL
jgi:hypothetical protein